MKINELDYSEIREKMIISVYGVNRNQRSESKDLGIGDLDKSSMSMFSFMTASSPKECFVLSSYMGFPMYIASVDYPFAVVEFVGDTNNGRRFIVDVREYKWKRLSSSYIKEVCKSQLDKDIIKDYIEQQLKYEELLEEGYILLSGEETNKEDITLE